MATFTHVDNDVLTARIAAAAWRLVFIAPAVSAEVANALVARFPSAGKLSITLILDTEEAPYRLGLGAPDGLSALHKAASEHQIPLRGQSGLRVGVLISDEAILIWSPTALAMDPAEDALNGFDPGVALGAATEALASASGDAACDPNLTVAEAFAQELCMAIASDDSSIDPSCAEVGSVPLSLHAVEATLQTLAQNPPAPLDLTRKTYVFSTRFQFVEFEVRGAAWTEREVKLSSLLNADLPPRLQDIFETRVRPFGDSRDVEVEVPAMVGDQLAFTQSGEPILTLMTQAEVNGRWNDLRKRYLIELRGFGWLLEKTRKEAFKAAVAGYEVVLKAWANGFAADAEKTRSAVSTQIVASVVKRLEGVPDQPWTAERVHAEVRRGLDNLRAITPNVRLVYKDVAWDSTRDLEFTEALRKALPKKTRDEPWFKEFAAVPINPS